MSKLDYLIISTCLIFSCFTFLVGNYLQMAHVEKPVFILTSSQPRLDLDHQLLLDPSTGKKIDLYITRLLHNKFIAFGNVLTVNLFRSSDLTFLFGITKDTSFYENKGALTLLYPPELLLFFLACFFWIKDWSYFKNTYLWVLIMLLLTFGATALILPYFFIPKYFPFVLMLRIFIYLTLWHVLQRKYHL